MVIDSIPALLAAVDRLPGQARAAAVARIDAAIALRAPLARLRLAELALELATDAPARVAEDPAMSLVRLPELAGMSRDR